LVVNSFSEKRSPPKMTKSLHSQLSSCQSSKLDQMLNEQIEMYNNKWNFNFETGTPKEGKFLWSDQKP
jgi:hypothetical protein